MSVGARLDPPSASGMPEAPQAPLPWAAPSASRSLITCNGR